MLKKITFLLVILALIVLPNFAYFQETLQITDIEVDVSGRFISIEWQTNIPSNGRVDYGLTKDYGNWVNTSPIKNDTQHRVDLSGLEKKKNYHFRITAYAGSQEVSTFDSVFNTDDYNDRTSPQIYDVNIEFITMTSATVQWRTSEPACGHVLVGTTANYGGAAGSGCDRTIHDVTLRLSSNTQYHINIESWDRDNNRSRWVDTVIRTLPYKTTENEPLTISRIEPATANDDKISIDHATITWQSNKLARGYIRYREEGRSGTNWIELGDRFRSFDHSYVLDKLKPDTEYVFIVAVKDVFGGWKQSEEHSFITKTQPKVLGTKVTGDLSKYSKASALYKSESDRKIYAIFNGMKYHISTPNLFNYYGFDWAQVRTISQTQISSIPDLRLIRDASSGKTFYLYDNVDGSKSKIHIPNEFIFNSYKSNSWDKVATLASQDINSYSDVKLVRSFENPSVYLLSNGTKKLIASESEFLASGYQWHDVKMINQTHLDFIPAN